MPTITSTSRRSTHAETVADRADRRADQPTAGSPSDRASSSAMLADPIIKTGRVSCVKIDPAQVDFHVRYQPESPLKVREWYSTTQALVVINSSFFDGAHHAVGQLTTDGKSDGLVHQRMEGAFYLTGVGAAVWPLQGWVKPAGLQIVESIESFPMLLLPRRNCQSRNSQRCPHRAAHGSRRGSSGQLVVYRDTRQSVYAARHGSVARQQRSRHRHGVEL
jgi:hypothetical protein